MVSKERSDKDHLFIYDKEKNYLPKSVIKWSGVGLRNPLVKLGDNSRVRLSEMNDEFAYSFNAIADAIESGM